MQGVEWFRIGHGPQNAPAIWRATCSSYSNRLQIAAWSNRQQGNLFLSLLKVFNLQP